MRLLALIIPFMATTGQIDAMTLACQTAMSGGYCVAQEPEPAPGTVVLYAGQRRVSASEAYRIRRMGWTKRADGSYEMCSAIAAECASPASDACIVIRSMWGTP